MKDSFRELTLAELTAKKEELSKKFFKLRFDMVMGHVENPLEKRVLRRKIARVNTLIQQKKSVGDTRLAAPAADGSGKAD
ncbi:MAG: 50S ribosomal protein L29 [Spirochaetales bacterium]|jgi:large subunit ribosomal protein L29|nr:50S ribosomal protein L29 [Spirochaetales bacterium]